MLVPDNLIVLTGAENADGSRPQKFMKGLSVTAVSTEDVSTFAVGGAASGSVSIAGSMNYNTYNETTQAYVDTGAKINDGASGLGSTQDINVMAWEETTLLSIAGGLSLGGDAGIGAGADTGQITKDTEAFIAGDNTTAARDITVQAISTEDVISVAANVNLGYYAAVTGSASVYIVSTTTKAYEGDNSTLTAGGNVTLLAKDDSDFSLAAGNVSIGMAGVGISNTTLVKTDDVEAYTGTYSTVHTHGSQGLTVSALATQNINAIAVGGAGGGAGVAGSATVEVLNETTKASIGIHSTIDASSTTSGVNPSVSVQAEDDTTILALAGTLTIGGNSGVGAGVDVGVITKDTEAWIASGANVTADGDVIDKAISDEDIKSISASIAGGGSNAIAINAGVSVYNFTTRAAIAPNGTDTATVAADGSVVVNAADTTNLDVISGNLTVSGSTSVGAAAGVTVITKTTEAFLGPHADVTALGTRANVTVDSGQFGVSYTNTSFDPSTAVNSTADTINLGYNHGLQTGDKVVYYNDGGTNINGLTDGQVYYAIVVNSTTIKLATSYDYAKAGTAINISNTGVEGRAHRIVSATDVAPTGMDSRSFDASKDVNYTTNVIDLGYDHGMSTGDAVVYRDGGTPR